VLACSDTTVQSKPRWRERKAAYLTHLANVDPSVLLVSAADKLHNLRDIIKDFRIMGDNLWERFKGGKSGTLWYHRAVVSAIRCRGFGPCDSPTG
jgi:(p)ppGpp synthase/HD superfamily hydrolase